MSIAVVKFFLDYGKIHTKLVCNQFLKESCRDCVGGIFK